MTSNGACRLCSALTNYCGSRLVGASSVSNGKPYSYLAGLHDGVYLRLDMTHTGVGINGAILARASEPFFTTKPAGAGTGLGFAMGRGFARQSGGGFEIRSSPGQGTTITLWFPQSYTTQEEDDQTLSLASPRPGHLR